MHVFMSPSQAAGVLHVHEKTVRRWIRRGAIRSVVTNGAGKNGVRYLIDMTKEYGLEEVPDGPETSDAA